MKKINYKKIAKNVIDLEIQALKKLRNSISGSFDQAVDAIVKCQSKTILCGVGKSYLIASKIAATLSSVGCPSFSLSASDCSHGDLGSISKKDLLITSNNATIGNNKEIIHYKNIGVNQDTFSFQTNSFLVGDMMDFGKSAYPIWVDENQDGLTDILIGNNALNYNGTIKATLSLLRNIGSKTHPSFEIITDDYLNFSENEETYLYPAIGDLDQDGDDDLLIGLQNGKILYLNNQAGANMPYDFLIASAEFENIDVGNYAAPVLFDVNGDSAIDLTVGEQNGSLFYYENQTDYGYDYSVETENFGGVSTQNYSDGIFFGYSTPYFFKDDEKIHLLVGGESGKTLG